MDKILIIGSFPAPYRIAVFEGLCNNYEADVFFATSKDEKRDHRFFVKKNEVSYYLLEEKIGREVFFEKIKTMQQYKAVVAYDWYLAYAMLAELVAILCRVPYVINCDGVIRKSYETFKFKDLVKRFFISNARYCFASGKHAENYFIHYGAKKLNIVRHNFTSLRKGDILEAVPSKQEKMICRDKLGFGEKKVVLSVGQFIYRKGFDLLLEAWEQLDSTYMLIIIGGGPEKKDYEDFVKKREYKNVKILDFVSHAEILNYMKASDLFVLPTREDIWGLVVNEAMAVGLPVITTNQCIAGEELLPHDYICPLEVFINKLPDMVKHLMESQYDYENTRIRNLKTIKNYTYENIIQSHISILEKL